MDAHEREILTRFKNLLQERVQCHQVILFGSRARGDADPDSDMDVLVILDESRTSEVRGIVSDCAWKAGFDDGVVVASVIFTREEWEEGPERYSPLADVVRAEGIPV